MAFVKLLYKDRGYYSYENASNVEMDILSSFLLEGPGCYSSIYKEWALADKEDSESKFAYECSANIIFLEEEGDYIYLTDKYSEEKIPTRLRISKKQFVKLLDDWNEKVCKVKPKEVIIKHENNEFVIETKS